MSKAKVCLAPIRFGAGLKGKLLDAMLYGTPAVTTRIGVEGMYGKDCALFSKDDEEKYINHSVSLYNDKSLWTKIQNKGSMILKEHYSKELFSNQFISRLNFIKENISSHRKQNFVGQILQHQSMQATKFMSRWIEEKNK